jgi:hypothetical protein
MELEGKTMAECKANGSEYYDRLRTIDRCKDAAELVDAVQSCASRISCEERARNPGAISTECPDEEKAYRDELAVAQCPPP